MFQTLYQRAVAGILVELMITNDAINFRGGGLPFDALHQASGRVFIIGSGGPKAPPTDTRNPPGDWSLEESYAMPTQS